MSFVIETKYEGNWTSEGLGDTNAFATQAEAWAALAMMLRVEPDWRGHEYRIAEREDHTCPWCDRAFASLDELSHHIGDRHVRQGINLRDDDPVYRRDMKDAGRGRLLR